MQVRIGRSQSRDEKAAGNKKDFGNFNQIGVGLAAHAANAPVEGESTA
jgi:hypothetical protein